MLKAEVEAGSLSFISHRCGESVWQMRPRGIRVYSGLGFRTDAVPNGETKLQEHPQSGNKHKNDGVLLAFCLHLSF